MSVKYFILFLLLTIVVMAFAAFMQYKSNLIRGIVISKHEIPEHTEVIDKGTLPYEVRYISEQHFLTIRSRTRTERVSVDQHTFDSALIGEEITIYR